MQERTSERNAGSLEFYNPDGSARFGMFEGLLQEELRDRIWHLRDILHSAEFGPGAVVQPSLPYYRKADVRIVAGVIMSD